LQQNSLRNRTGDYFGGTGNSETGIGNFRRPNPKTLPDEVFGTHRRQPASVITLLTYHLAAAAIDIMTKFTPNWEPTTLRNAARFMRSGAAHLDDA